MKELCISQKKSREIYFNNSSVIVLAKSHMFHEKNKHINIKFYYLWDCITNEEFEVKNVKTQDQVIYSFTKPIKYDIFTEMRDMLGVIRMKFRGEYWKN